MESNRLRLGLGVLLAAAAVLLFVVLSGEDDDGGDARQTTTAARTTGSAGGNGKPGGGGKPPAPKLETIAVKGGEPVGGVQDLDFGAGERIRFAVRSDTEGEVHVHGYELTKPITAGGTVRFDFRAELQGGYEVELHLHEGGEAPIAELTVRPG